MSRVANLSVKKPIPLSFFQPAMGLTGPAREAEERAVDRRRHTHIRLSSELRAANRAADTFRGLDATRQTAAGIEHIKAHRDRLLNAFAIFLDEAEKFVEQNGEAK